MAALMDKSKTGSLALPIAMTDGSILRPRSSTTQTSVFQAYYGKEPVPPSSVLAEPPFPVRDRTQRRPSIGSSSVSDVVQRRMFRRRKSLEAISQQQDCPEDSKDGSSESIPDLFSLVRADTADDEECFIHRQLEHPVEPRTQLKSDIFGEYEVGLKGRGIAIVSSRTGGDLDQQNPHQEEHQRSRSVEEESCPRRTPASFSFDHFAATTNSSIRRSGSTGDLLDNRSSWGRHRRRPSIDPSRRCPPPRLSVASSTSSGRMLHYNRASSEAAEEGGNSRVDGQRAMYAKWLADQQQQDAVLQKTKKSPQRGGGSPEIPATRSATSRRRSIRRLATTSLCDEDTTTIRGSSSHSRLSAISKSPKRLGEEFGPRATSPRAKTISLKQSTIDALLTSNSQHTSRRKANTKKKLDSFSGSATSSRGETTTISSSSILKSDGSSRSSATTRMRRPKSLGSMD